ncbi:MAG: hypothetical protein JNL95_08925 [Chitinophagales bacterium]|nr:hypothetical protein [Chitinophagales bacterium]
MTDSKAFLILVFLTFTNFVNAQFFDNSFHGEHGRTYFALYFKKDGSFMKETRGHLGNFSDEGFYTINKDSIWAFTINKQTNDTLLRSYLLDKDSMLIDFSSRYDYAPLTKYIKNLYFSKVRRVKYPQVETIDNSTKQTLDTLLNQALNNESARQFYHFDKIPERKLVIAKYLALEANVSVDTHKAIFKPVNEITDPFYIEIIDINQNHENVSISIMIHGESARIDFVFLKKDNNWICWKPSVTENK